MTKIFNIEKLKDYKLPDFPKKQTFTEEDMQKCFDEGVATGINDWSRKPAFNGLIKSLNPLPIAVEVECDTIPIDSNGNVIGTGMSYPYKELLANFTIKYIPKVVNNILQVVKWIYAKKD